MKRFIEADFPIRAVSEHSAREKNIRHGHISTLHIWWARRLGSVFRMLILAASIVMGARSFAVDKYRQVKKAVEVKEKELREIYEIERVALSLAGLIEAQH